MASYDYDVIIIGSGAGGNIAAQLIAKAGKSVAVTESAVVGGQAPNYACVPTKALLQAAEIYETTKRSAIFGIRGATVGYNYPSIKAWKDLAVKRTGIEASERNFIENGINLVHGRAHFINPHTISVGKARFSAREFLIATGSELSLPEIPGLTKSGFLTYREAINLLRPPKNLAIIGGGETGCELAQLFAIFGTKVHLIDSAPRLLENEEPEISVLLEKRFAEAYAINVRLNCTVEQIEKVGLSRRLVVKSDGRKQVLHVDEVLLASGKRAVTDIGLENAGVHYQDGVIATNNHLRTSAPHIYAAGDCTSPYAYTHTAVYQSQIAAHNLLHSKRPATIDYRAVPRCIFTTPEIAAVGPTERELKAQKISFKSTSVPLSVITRSNTANFTDGFVKVIKSSKTGVLLGATIVSPHAGEMIHELTLAVQNYLKPEHVANTIHAFPTWSEAVRVACVKLAKI